MPSSPKAQISGGKAAFVSNALRTTRSNFLQINRFRLSQLCGTRRPEDCTVPGKATALQPLRCAKRARRLQGDGYKLPPDQRQHQIFLSAISWMRLHRSDRVPIE
jgi:hypothetical protein